MINTTLIYLEKDGAYLMLHRIKKKEDLNEGKWIGVGARWRRMRHRSVRRA
jgi:8-oxo-dGTP diphosphatase